MSECQCGCRIWSPRTNRRGRLHHSKPHPWLVWRPGTGARACLHCPDNEWDSAATAARTPIPAPQSSHHFPFSSFCKAAWWPRKSPGKFWLYNSSVPWQQSPQPGCLDIPRDSLGTLTKAEGHWLCGESQEREGGGRGKTEPATCSLSVFGLNKYKFNIFYPLSICAAAHFCV